MQCRAGRGAGTVHDYQCLSQTDGCDGWTQRQNTHNDNIFEMHA